MRFLSTPSARRATQIPKVWYNIIKISIHALREEGDRFFCRASNFDLRFLSTPSARRATQLVISATSDGLISIHALREEGDFIIQNHFHVRIISIHALREEGDSMRMLLCIKNKEFLSTPSARRATAKTETKSLFSNKLYNILHEFRRALIYNGSKNYPNHAK